MRKNKQSLAFARLCKMTPYLLTFLSAILMLVIGTFFLEQIAFFKVNWWENMNKSEFIASFFTFVLSFSLFCYFERRFFKVKIKWLFLIVIALSVIHNIIAALSVPEVTRYFAINHGYAEMTYSMADKFKDCIVYLVFGCMMYALCAMIPQTIRSVRSLTVFFYTMVIVAIVAIIYSLVKENAVYTVYFDGTDKKIPNVNLMSFLNNQNTFVTILLFAMCAVAYLHTQKPHFWNYIIIHFLWFWTLMINSQGGILLSTLLIFGFIIYRFIHCLNEHMLSHFLGLFSYVGCIILIIVLCRNNVIPETNPIYKFVDHLFFCLQQFEIEESTLNHRTVIWSTICSNCLSPMAIIFGQGELYCNRAFAAMMGSTAPAFSAHNGYVHLYFSGGFIRLLVLLAFIAYIVYIGIDCIANKKKAIGFICLINIVIYLLHGLIEDTAFLIPDAKGIIGIILFCLPLFIDKEQRSQPRIAKRLSFEYEMTPPKLKFTPNPVPSGMVALFISSIVLVLPVCYYHINIHGDAYFASVGRLSILLLPFIASFVLSLFCYSLAFVKKSTRIFGYILFVLSLIFIHVLLALIGNKVIDKSLFMTLGYLYLGVILILALLAFFIKRGRIRWGYPIFCMFFAILYAALISIAHVYSSYTTDNRYLAIAFVLGGFIASFFLFAFIWNNAPCMKSSWIKWCIIEYKVHRFLGRLYACDQLYDEAYETGMKVFHHHFIGL